MNFFEEATLRLKQQLKLSQDKEVAKTLGLSAQNWAGRKKRGHFPEKDLLVLIIRRPELGLDFDYIMLGIHSQQFEAGIAKAARQPLISPDERLAGLYGQLTPASRKVVLEVALRLRELEMLMKRGE